MIVGEARRRTLSDELAAGVVDLIHQRGLAVGDQLDSVRALAETFGVAVPTMREALRRLEAFGLVALRHGSGVYVGEHIGRTVLANPLGLAPTGERLVDLLEARKVIEPPTAALAAAYADDEGRARIADTVDDARQCLKGDQGRLWVVNLDFHRALAIASGNTVLSEVVDSIVLVHAGEQREILRIHGDESLDFDEHEKIADAVLAGDAAAAHRATEEHLTNVIAAIRPENRRSR